MQKTEYEAMVSRVRKHYGPSVEIGGFISHDIIKLQRLAAQADQDQANDRASRPLVEAGTRLHKTRDRAQKAWQKISDGQATLAKNRRVHEINGVAAEMLERIDMPKWPDRAPATVDEYDAANAEAAEIATEMETRASKVQSYVNQWECSSTEQQNRALILALADRLERAGIAL
jgi:cell division protein FtsL